MKRLALQLAFAVTAAFALTAAAPALACGKDCGDCPMHKAAAADGKAAAPAGKVAPKQDAKPAEKAAPAAPAAPAAAPASGEKKAEAPTQCNCEKGGKGCICKKGECKCANCGAGTKLSAAEQPKPKCECAGGKDCGCKKTDKGECGCKHGAGAAPKAT